MWDAVRKIADEEGLTKSPPFSMVEFLGRKLMEAEAPQYLEDNSSINTSLSRRLCHLIWETMNQDL